jgi:hypothetical protein
VSEPVISYSAKELLERMESKMDTGFRDVNARLDGLGSRVGTLEADRTRKTDRRQSFRLALTTVATVIASVAAAVGVIHI